MPRRWRAPSRAVKRGTSAARAACCGAREKAPATLSASSRCGSTAIRTPCGSRWSSQAVAPATPGGARASIAQCRLAAAPTRSCWSFATRENASIPKRCTESRRNKFKSDAQLSIGLHAIGLDHGRSGRRRQERHELLRGGRLLRRGANTGRVYGRELQLGRQRTDNLDAPHRKNLADLLDGDLDLAVGDQFGVEARAIVQLGLCLHLISDPEALEHLGEVDAARGAEGRVGVDDRFRRKQRPLQRLGRADVGLGCAGAYAETNAGARQDDLAIRRDAALLDEVIKRGGGKDEHVHRFAGRNTPLDHAWRAIDRGDLVLGSTLEGSAEVGQHHLHGTGAHEFDFGRVGRTCQCDGECGHDDERGLFSHGMAPGRWSGQNNTPDARLIYDLSAAGLARASNCLARARWGRSYMTPSMPTTPAPGSAANAATTALALAMASAAGVNTALITSTCAGWIASLAVNPSRRASSASRRRPAGLRKST